MLLRTLIVYLEEHITVHLHKLVGTLCRCANGLSAEWSRECTALVCKFVPVDSFVALVLPIVNMDVDGAKGLRLGGCGGNTRARALVVLSEIVRGVKRQRLAPHAADIAACLGGDLDAAETRDALERSEYLKCARAFGDKFQGKAEFVNDKTGRLVSLRTGVGKLLECVERARMLGVKDAEVGTVGAAAAAELKGPHAVVEPDSWTRATRRTSRGLVLAGGKRTRTATGKRKPDASAFSTPTATSRRTSPITSAPRGGGRSTAPGRCCGTSSAGPTPSLYTPRV